ncbi:MAG TPA: NAD(P)-dependent oxidoreductase [Vitreimonas sp.]|uniref:precorrin-2 dehydrogenase/sirohydrochlorin ferrochelatase family protein n=1 Tax=Vitreimonas sp. TaxID=3069702 RepID=UPI002D637486|nr:NAD(P)-dependent oxidoreductase [Vitreimonas sp.]HYD86875.1 NAD(P)-dependent oxidoreductase [Vitreimonas sp.]
MIPVFIDPAATRIALIGRATLAARRLNWLKQAGAAPDVWSDAPDAGLENAAGDRLERRLPSAQELMRYHAVWIADLPREFAAPLAEAARTAAVLVNVEDVTDLCDFHTPAVVRRGRLTLAVGTGGASPAAARAARERLEAAFPVAWAEALDEIADARVALRRLGAPAETLIADAGARLARHGLT